MSTILAQRGAAPHAPSAGAPAVPVLIAAIPTAPVPGAGIGAWSPAELAQSIAHEINQPLAAILLQAGAARRWLDRTEPDIGQVLAALDEIAAAGKRVDDIVRNVQALVEHRPPEAAPLCVDTLLRRTVATLACSLHHQRIEARLVLELDGVTLHANRVQIEQVALNLLGNAVEALAALDERPRILTLSSRRLGVGLVEIAVADNGAGVAPEHLAHLFGAGFSTKAQGRGLGLSISAAIARAHGGRIEHQAGAPHGAVFRLVLPAGAG